MAYSDNFVADLLSLVDSVVAADKMEFSEMLYEKSFETSNIAESHEIVTGVRTGQVVPILKDTPNPESFPFVDETSCATVECDIAEEFSSMRWELGLIECRVPICLRTFNENFLRFFNVWRQTEEGEPDLDSALVQFISSRFNKNLLLSQWRASYFGDKDSLSAYFNGIDGFWKQAEAIPELVVPITQNAGLTFVEQIITGEEVYNYLTDMYDMAIAFPWFDISTFEYKVTKTMGLKLISWLNKLGKNAPMNCECIDPDKAVAKNVYSLDNVYINGIPVRIFNEFDDVINFSTELNGGGGAAARVQPHRAILAAKNNMLIGTSQVSALESFDIWYDKTDKKVYLEGSSYLGAALPMPEYIVAL